MIRQLPTSTLFPYTTLFRSHRDSTGRARVARLRARAVGLDDDTDRPRTQPGEDRKSTRLNSSHLGISYAVFCLKKKKKKKNESHVKSQREQNHNNTSTHQYR